MPQLHTPAEPGQQTPRTATPDQSGTPIRSHSAERKLRIAQLSLVLVAPVVLYYGWGDLQQGRLMEGALVLATGVLALLGLGVLHLTGRTVLVATLMSVWALGLQVYELALHSAEGHALIFFYFFPAAVFWVLGRRLGGAFALASVLIAAVLMLLLPATATAYAASTDAPLMYVVIYALLALLAFGIESSRAATERALRDERRVAEAALLEVAVLRGIVPVCATCNSVRDDQGNWLHMEHYLAHRTELSFSHSICPECYANTIAKLERAG